MSDDQWPAQPEPPGPGFGAPASPQGQQGWGTPPPDPGQPGQPGPPAVPPQHQPPGPQQPGPPQPAAPGWGPAPGGGQPPPAPRQPGPIDLAANHPPPETPLHPLLPAGADPHHQPHAASAGPSDGARGALWFPLLMALVVFGSLIGILVLLAGR